MTEVTNEVLQQMLRGDSIMIKTFIIKPGDQPSEEMLKEVIEASKNLFP